MLTYREKLIVLLIREWPVCDICHKKWHFCHWVTYLYLGKNHPKIALWHMFPYQVLKQITNIYTKLMYYECNSHNLVFFTLFWSSVETAKFWFSMTKIDMKYWSSILFLLQVCSITIYLYPQEKLLNLKHYFLVKKLIQNDTKSKYPHCMTSRTEMSAKHTQQAWSPIQILNITQYFDISFMLLSFIYSSIHLHIIVSIESWCKLFNGLKLNVPWNITTLGFASVR